MNTIYIIYFSILFSIILIIASIQDIKKRVVSDNLWKIAIFFYIILNHSNIIKRIFEINYIEFFIFLISFAVLILFFHVIFHLKMMGGADLKCFLLIFIFYYNISYFFPVTFLNSLLITLLYPILIFLYNILFDIENIIKKPVFLFLGFKKDIYSDLVNEKKRENKTEKYCLLERIDTKNPINTENKYFGIDVFSEEEKNYREDLLKLMKENKEMKKQWISPKIPFISSIAAGYLITCFIFFRL